MSKARLPADFADLPECLGEAGVEYMLIGGYAVMVSRASAVAGRSGCGTPVGQDLMVALTFVDGTLHRGSKFLTLPSSVYEQEKYQLRTRVAEHLRLAGPEKVDLVVLPAMKVGMEPVTRARKDKLAASIETAFDARIDRTKVPKPLTPLDDASLLAVCRTCRGACCKWGEDHAYLTRAVLSRVKAEQRIANEASLLEAYLERVPKLARQGSCIYHGDHGCALPRAMRSETCNRYLCYPLKQLGRDFSSAGYAQLAVSTDAEKEDRMLLLSEGETRPVRPESWKPGSD